MRASGRIFLSVHAFLFFSLILVPIQISRGQTASAATPSQISTLGTPQAGLPGKWNDAVKTLAAKIAIAVTPSRAISLEVKNSSSLGPTNVEAIRKALSADLADRGLHLGSSGVEVKITLSENVEGYIWVAEIPGNKQSPIALSQLTRRDLTVPARATPMLQRKIESSSRIPILDFASLDLDKPVGSLKLVFGPGYISTFEFIPDQFSDNRAQLKGFLMGPRDLRGLLTASKDGSVRMFAAGDECVGRIQGEPYCGPSSSQNWPFPFGLLGHFVANRNYFAGFANGTAGSLTQHAFYSAAIGLNIFDRSNPIIETELDGKSRLYEDSDKAIATFAGWGDDIASVNRSCGEHWEILATGIGDWTQPDHIQTYEVSLESGSATPVGQPLEFPGPILEMRQSDDGKSARVVSKNLQTGMYEASVVTVTCSE
jgi:hypothetical protein